MLCSTCFFFPLCVLVCVISIYASSSLLILFLVECPPKACTYLSRGFRTLPFNLLCSTSVLITRIALPTLSIRALNSVILNSPSDSPNICVITDSCSDDYFVSWQFSLLFCLLYNLLKTEHFV